MKLKNDEKRWLVRALGWLGAVIAFVALGAGAIGFFVGVLIWCASLVLVVRFDLGKENDRA